MQWGVTPAPLYDLMQEASRRVRTSIFKNGDVSYVYRRLVANAITILDELKRETQLFARQLSDDYEWERLWRTNLPLVELYNVRVQQNMADEFLRTQKPDFLSALDVTYETYVACNFGKTADGRVNNVSFTPPPLHEFYHAFLTHLMREPHVVRTSVFHNMVNDIYDVVERAFLDALRAVFHGRVTVLETRTKKELREQLLQKAAGAPSSVSSDSTDESDESSESDIVKPKLPKVPVLKDAPPASSFGAAASDVKSSQSIISAWKDSMRVEHGQQRKSAFAAVPSRDMTRPSDSVTQISMQMPPTPAFAIPVPTPAPKPASERSDIRVLPTRSVTRKPPAAAPAAASAISRDTESKLTDASSSVTRSVVY